jgi:hypothetical protein
VEQVLLGSRGDGEGEVAQTMYTHVSKCSKEKKIKKKKYEESNCESKRKLW